MNELFGQWNEHPPTSVLVKALVDGFAGAKAPPKSVEEAAQRAGISEGDLMKLRTQVGRALPIQAKDPGLPAQAPVFDLGAMREKNAHRLKATAKAR